MSRPSRAPGEDLASRQILCQGLVHRRDDQGVEAVHGPDGREFRLPDAAYRCTALSIHSLQFSDAQQLVLIVHMFNRALPCSLVQLEQDGGQATLMPWLARLTPRVGGGVGRT